MVDKGNKAKFCPMLSDHQMCEKMLVRVCVSRKGGRRRRKSDREGKRSSSFVHRQHAYGWQSVMHVVWFLIDQATYLLTHGGTNTAVVPSGTNTKQSRVVNTTKQAAILKYS